MKQSHENTAVVSAAATQQTAKPIHWGDSEFTIQEHERARFRSVFPNQQDVTLREAIKACSAAKPD